MPETDTAPEDVIEVQTRIIDEDAISHSDLAMQKDHLTPTPRHGGTPTKFSIARVDHICESLKLGNSRAASARSAGIAGETLRKWIEINDDVREQVENAESEAERSMLLTIKKATQAGDWRAAAWWLERRRYATWGRKDKQDIESIIRSLAPSLGLNAEETEAAVADAKRVMLEGSSAHN